MNEKSATRRDTTAAVVVLVIGAVALAFGLITMPGAYVPQLIGHRFDP